MFAAVVAAYWVTIALGGRPPNSSRYMFAGAVLVLLVLADAASGLRLPSAAVLAMFVVVGLAIPPNIAKYYDGRRVLLNDAAATRTEAAMVELAAAEVEPGFKPGADPEIVQLGGGVGVPLPAGDYLRAAEEFGSLAYSLDEVAAEPLPMREVADATLIKAKRVALGPSDAPSSRQGCYRISDATASDFAYFPLPPEGVRLGRTREGVPVRLSRFAKEGPGFVIGEVEPGSWDSLKIAPDAAPQRWRVLVGGPVYRLPGGLAPLRRRSRHGARFPPRRCPAARRSAAARPATPLAWRSGRRRRGGSRRG